MEIILYNQIQPKACVASVFLNMLGVCYVLVQKKCRFNYHNMLMDPTTYYFMYIIELIFSCVSHYLHFWSHSTIPFGGSTSLNFTTGLTRKNPSFSFEPRSKKTEVPYLPLKAWLFNEWDPYVNGLLKKYPHNWGQKKKKKNIPNKSPKQTGEPWNPVTLEPWMLWFSGHKFFRYGKKMDKSISLELQLTSIQSNWAKLFQNAQNAHLLWN